MNLVFSGLGESELQALSSSLSIIPLVKKIKLFNEKNEVSEQEIVTTITLQNLLRTLKTVDDIELDDDQLFLLLTGALVVLETLGIIGTEYENGDIKIWATSEPASFLLKNMGCFVENRLNYHRSFILPNSEIEFFQPILERAIEIGKLNPHLVFSNLIAYRFQGSVEPLRKQQIVSVLIKGRRIIRGFFRQRTVEEVVYLHIYKPGWDSYALIGSRREDGQTLEETARLALKEDLKTPSNNFILQPSDVPDVMVERPSISRGVITRYAFNLFVVTGVTSKLLLRRDSEKIKYRWFTYEEIKLGISRTGEAIMTNTELIDSYHEKNNLDLVPTIVFPHEIPETEPFRHKLNLIKQDFQSGFQRLWDLFIELLMKMWFYKWAVLALPIFIMLFLVLRPLLNRSIPSLNNIDSLLGISMFLVYIIGAFKERQRRKL